ncbi:MULTISPECIES: hypothetical protein [unclassified Streptomyces]|uniref:hypothetical protein n=1 Tax=unclassified Streptomyces TaxID=2593676 RepID=UPI002250459D|nr:MULTISPECIES: hypothetical protein [unclassified Streptomyces]MCX4625697.1 hypothetical protein [Streptomyces sp. NBC_01443]WSW41746.1 hypothetical protein OG296_00530 [Streptomyces sp. NBC_01001]
MGITRTLARGASALVLTCGVLLGVPAAGLAAVPVQPSDACVASDNLGEIANNFISRCRKGSIRQAFPGEHYGDSLGYIRGCGLKSCQTAWKLLNDNRFKK